jgi:hypothetical protein
MPAGLIDGERRMHAGRAIWVTISARCRFHRFAIASQHAERGAFAVLGQIAPEMYAEAVRWSFGALGRVPRLAQRRVILFFWPMRASSANQISVMAGSTFFSRAISSTRVGKFFYIRQWPPSAWA